MNGISQWILWIGWIWLNMASNSWFCGNGTRKWLYTLSLMNSTYPYKLWEKSSTSYAGMLAQKSISLWYCHAVKININKFWFNIQKIYLLTPGAFVLLFCLQWKEDNSLGKVIEITKHMNNKWINCINNFNFIDQNM